MSTPILKKILFKNKKINLNKIINIDNYTNIDDITKKIAIVVLTRGYSEINNYYKLIQRNKCIENNLSDYSIELLIFHEGNITENQQIEIKKNTPKLNIIFKSIINKSFLKEKERLEFNIHTKFFKINYRHMCNFWFIDFWKFVENYDRIIRIDEDCYIDFNPIDIFNLLDSKVAIYGHWEDDSDFVTIGLNDFTVNFFNNKNIKINKYTPSGPYTNIIALNLELLKQNSLLNEYIDKIDKSNNIYIYRWGDLPLWGEVLKYMYKETDHLLLKSIKYYHQSHNKIINN